MYYSLLIIHTGRAEFLDESRTIDVAEGSVANLSCKVNNRGKSDQIIWSSRDKKQSTPEKLIVTCEKKDHTKNSKRKDGCVLMVSPKELDPRLR